MNKDDNQCDGCNANKPLKDGMHRMGDEGKYPDLMRCTKKLYESNKEDKELLKEILKEIIIEQATREMSGVQWATDMLSKLNDLGKELASPIETNKQ